MNGQNFKKKYLFLLAKNRDPKAFSQLFELYVDQIYRFIYFKISEKEDAQDLTSEVFLKTWQYLSEGKKVENLNALFYTVARNLVIDFYRQKRNREILVENDSLLEQDNVNIDDEQIHRIEVKIESDKIIDYLMGLKDEFREVIILRYIEGFDIKEIAQIMDKKKGNIRIILFRALNALKELINQK